MNENQKPLEVFRDGSIGASVWERLGKHGPYFEFTVSRSYKKDDGFGYATTYRQRDGEAVKRVVDAAVHFIHERSATTRLAGETPERDTMNPLGEFVNE